MSWSFQLHDTISGDLLAVVDPSAGNWRRALGEGSGSHSFQLRSAGHWRGLNARMLGDPNSVTLVVLFMDVAVYAGMLLSVDYDRDSGVMTVNHVEGVRHHFRNRMTFGTGGYDAATGDLVITGKSAAGAVRAILKYGIGDDGRGGPEWRLPIDLPPDSAGLFSFTWRHWQHKTITDCLGEIEAVGYEIDFEPYIHSDGRLRYRTRIGDVINDGFMEFSVTAAESPVQGLKITVDGSKQVTGVFMVGKGSEADMMVGQAGNLTGPSVPVRDAKRSAKDVSDQNQLNRMALADLQANLNAVSQWEFKLRNSQTVDGAWLLHFQDLRHGTVIRLWSYGDDFIDDGSHDVRVVGLSGDMGFAVTPEVQPV